MGVPDGAFGDARGLVRAGDALVSASEIAYEREAVADANLIVQSTKRKLNEYRAEARHDRGTDPDTPHFERMVPEFDDYAQKLQKDAVGGTRNRKAQAVIAQTLSGYVEQTRQHIAGEAQKRKEAAYRAATFNMLDDLARDRNMPPEERARSIDQTLGQAVAIGAMDEDDAVKERRRIEQDIRYGDWFAAIQGAEDLPRAAEIRGALSRYDSGLSPEKNRDLLTQANARIAELEKRSEKAVEAQREDVLKMFENEKNKGTFSTGMVERWKPLLSADDYARQMHDARTMGSRQAEGSDDADTSRRLLAEINKAYQDPGKLRALRERVNDAARGYDPATKSFGTPSLSRSTARTYINDIDEYLGRMRSESREQRTDKTDERARKSKERSEVEQLLRQYYGTYMKSFRLDPSGTKTREAEQQMTKELGSLLKDGYDDPMGWFEQWKKRSEHIINAKTPLPSWVPQKGGKPDWDAARKALADQLGAKKMTREMYDIQFRTLQQLEREYAR